jgi:Yip1 domain
MAESSSLAVAANIFVAPNEAFASIKERPRVLLPILLLVLFYSAISLVYMTSVDLPWFMEQQLASSNPDVTEEQREQALRAAENLPGVALGAIGAVTSSIAILLYIFIIALYYTGVSFITHDGIKLKQWFALICWCSLPVLLGLMASLVNILFGDARFMLQEDLNPLAFGNLLGIDIENPTVLQRIMLGIDLTSLWCVVLMVLGYQAWTQSSLVKTVAVVLGPLLVIVAIGLGFALT